MEANGTKSNPYWSEYFRLNQDQAKYNLEQQASWAGLLNGYQYTHMFQFGIAITSYCQHDDALRTRYSKITTSCSS